MTRTMLIITLAIIIGIIITMEITTVRSTISVIKLASPAEELYSQQRESHIWLWRSSSRCEAVQTNAQSEENNKNPLHEKTKDVCAHLPKCRVLEHETGPLCSRALSCFGRLKLAGRRAAKSSGRSSREAGRTTPFQYYLIFLQS